MNAINYLRSPVILKIKKENFSNIPTFSAQLSKPCTCVCVCVSWSSWCQFNDRQHHNSPACLPGWLLRALFDVVCGRAGAALATLLIRHVAGTFRPAAVCGRIRSQCAMSGQRTSVRQANTNAACLLLSLSLSLTLSASLSRLSCELTLWQFPQARAQFWISVYTSALAGKTMINSAAISWA